MGLFKQIRRALVTKSGEDTDQFRVQQATYLGKNADHEIVFGYGHSANLPPEALLLTFAVEGHSENRAAIGDMPQERIDGLKSGEVIFFHPLTKSYIYFKENGDIEVVGVNDITVTAAGKIDATAGTSISATAGTTIDATAGTGITATSTLGNIDVEAVVGNVNVTAAVKITLDAPLIDLDTDVTVKGKLTVDDTSLFKKAVVMNDTLTLPNKPVAAKTPGLIIIP
jgi:hypothetical protein